MGIGGMMGLGGGRMPDFSAMRDKMLQKADGDGDGALSLKEFQETGTKMPIGKGMTAEKAKEAFAKIDSDGDGSLSKNEMKSFGDRMSSQMQGAMIGLQALMGGGQGAGGMSGGVPDPSAIFGEADGDKDGKVSRSEFDAAGQSSPFGAMMARDDAAAMFGQIDRDGDGSLSQDEMSGFGEQMKQKAGQMTSAGAPADFQQALNAYRQGSRQDGDLTSILLKALDGKGGVSA